MLAVLVLSANCADAKGVGKDAAALIKLTRTPQATYSLYIWNDIHPIGGEEVEEWSAEFNRGSLHRVETPRDRIVADCAAMTGIHYNVVTGKTTRGAAIAGAACGIQANATILSATVDGRVRDTVVPATRLVVTDPDFVRTYDVASNGALVATTISDHQEHLLLNGYAVALQTTVPNGIFDEESLRESAVPEEFRHRPAERSD